MRWSSVMDSAPSMALAVAASRLRLLGLLSIGLIGTATAAMITLAANAALAANAQVIRVLRLVGARDSYIARAFVRRFTLRALGGAAVGTALGMLGVALLPSTDTAGGFLTGGGAELAGLADGMRQRVLAAMDADRVRLRCCKALPSAVGLLLHCWLGHTACSYALVRACALSGCAADFHAVACAYTWVPAQQGDGTL